MYSIHGLVGAAIPSIQPIKNDDLKRMASRSERKHIKHERCEKIIHAALVVIWTPRTSISVVFHLAKACSPKSRQGHWQYTT